MDTENAALSILIVDDEANIRKTLAVCLEAEGHSVVSVGSASEAIQAVTRQSFALAFVDVRLGTTSGLDLVPELLTLAPWLKIVVITAYASIETAVEAMRRGAIDYIAKPFTPPQVLIAVRKMSEMRSLELRLQQVQHDLAGASPDVDLTSTSPVMQRALELARQVAQSEASVLILGESGTGKTVLAKVIHAWSRRARKPFGVVSCPSLSGELLESELFGHVRGSFTGAVRDNPGRVMACEGGTLFLDEIGELPLPLQPKLLRFIQDKEYESIGDVRTRRADVRIIAATNTDLALAVSDGRFREDLYYRLNVFQLEIPPLRERTADIVPIAKRLLAFFGTATHRGFLGFTDEAERVLTEYPWPGNLRELRNVIERATIVCTGDSVGIEHLPDSMVSRESQPRIGERISLAELEEQHIRRVLATTSSLQAAAEILGIDQATLWRRRKQYGIT
ncbi:MAG: sigma-54 dependent transcriptional regulator [Candidatus Hydrogenedentes bacterium]|nr:sigma-54 dependent transcriptional regulator [Candidatus Hydrogenedentota bacterium]